MINTMTDKNLNELLTELNDALEKIEEIDPETRALVKDLDEDINRLLESGEDDFDSVVERAQSVQTRFALEHPVAERFVRYDAVGWLKKKDHVDPLTAALRRARAAGHLGAYEPKDGSCMVYVDFRRRFGGGKAKCLKRQ